jgi:hypothetical protein
LVLVERREEPLDADLPVPLARHAIGVDHEHDAFLAASRGGEFGAPWRW